MSLETKTDHDNIAKIIHGGDAFLSLFPFSSGGFHHLNLSSFRTSIVDMAKKLTADIRIFNETGGQCKLWFFFSWRTPLY